MNINHLTQAELDMILSALKRNVRIDPREAIFILAKALAHIPQDDEDTRSLLLALHQFFDELSHGEPL